MFDSLLRVKLILIESILKNCFDTNGQGIMRKTAKYS